MKALPWIVAGASVAVVAYLTLNAPSPSYVGTGDDLDVAASKAAAWGTKRRVSGTGDSLIGKVKEGVGNLTGNPDLHDEGMVDQAVGAVKDTLGQAAHVVSDALHDLGRS